ncbi:MAG: hypothetical protein NTY96_10260 [Bacteroidetes bacterium]|nr:hypothetical protein [Bacteroidota bacterium]
MKNPAGIWINFGIVLIILLSFFTFSENYFPLLNSDMAVNILMTPSFSLPHDIYFWGQDRSGNLIPMVAHWLYMITLCQPVILVSIVHYFILAAGFWALTRFVHTGYGRIVLAMVWFFPPWHFLEFLLILYGIQASCVILALNFLDRSFSTRVQWKCLMWLSLSCFVFILALWVSDMALISILALLLMGGLYFLTAHKDSVKLFSWRSMLVPAFCVLILTIAGYLVLNYAKAVSTPVQSYNSGFLANPSSIISNLNIVLDSVIRVFLFSSESGIESVFAWGLLLIILVLIFSKKGHLKSWPKITSNPWFYFFFFEALLTFIAVLSSGWVAANGAGRRYFTTFFMSAWISLLLWLETLPENKIKKQFRLALLAVVIIGSLSGSFRFYYPEIKPSRIRVISALKSLGNIGIIAEYWNSYMSASPDPVHIKATPHDKDYVRNPELVKEVLEQPILYLVKDGWIDSFPDTIIQFGKTLKKKGKSIHIADSWLNRYEVIR